MLEDIDVKRKVGKADFRRQSEPLRLRLAELQRQAKQLGIPIMVVFEGWDAAGKGALINELIQPLDPRGFKVTCAHAPSSEETRRPFLWRFWIRLPPAGRMVIFDRSWYRRVQDDRVEKRGKTADFIRAYDDIRSFERLLTDAGYVIIKFFLHISRGEQKRRLDELRQDPNTAWRVTGADLRRFHLHKEYLKAIDDMILQTDTEFAPWTVVEAHDQRFATLKILSTVVNALTARVDQCQRTRPRAAQKPALLPEKLTVSILDSADLGRSLTRDEYRRRLPKAQNRLRDLEYEIFRRGVPVVLVYEGWDAAGKGGNIRRLTENLDPRGYEVIPISAPTEAEMAHHYLWRFWNALPKTGHLAIFDRSWYGRVMVERVEGFCTTAEWQRAYREINEMEQHLANSGAVVLKFWLHIDKAEQLRRFRERERNTHKQWKITREDWRNRQKWDAYKAAVEEMIFRTSTPYAPWIVVESNCKLHARVKVIETVCAAIEKRIGD